MAELEPSDLMGSASAPLVRVPVDTLENYHLTPQQQFEVPGLLADGQSTPDGELPGVDLFVNSVHPILGTTPPAATKDRVPPPATPPPAIF